MRCGRVLWGPVFAVFVREQGVEDEMRERHDCGPEWCASIDDGVCDGKADGGALVGVPCFHAPSVKDVVVVVVLLFVGGSFLSYALCSFNVGDIAWSVSNR